MFSRWLVCLLLGGVAFAQAASPAPAPAQSPQSGANMAAEKTAAKAKVDPSDAVITLKRPCDDPAKKDQTCDTVVTREQFEKVAEALQPNMPPALKIRLANAYAKLVIMSNEAEKRGLDKNPRFEENLRFARMQVLSQQLNTTLQEEASKVSDSELEKYYNEKKETYIEANLQRIYLPRTKQLAPPKPTAVKKSAAAEKAEKEAREKAGEAAMTKTAAALRARAAKGENFDTLEKEGYLRAGLKGNPPSTKMDKTRPTMLPKAHQAALQLETGAVSEVISDATGHYIYKMVSKRTLPLETVKPEIKNWIASQRYRDSMEALQANPQLNEAYFEIPPKPKPQPGQQETEEDVDPD